MEVNEITMGLEESLEMRYEQFYRKQGIRYPQQLREPRLYPFDQLEEIDHVIWHYLMPRDEGDPKSFGVAEDHPIVSNKNKRQCSYHVPEFTIRANGPQRKKTFNVKLAIKAYHRKNSNIYWLRTPDKIRQFEKKRPWNIVIDYSLMGRKIDFRPSPMKFIFEWEAYYSNYLAGVRDQLKASKMRHQLMFFHIPDELPSIQQIRMASVNLKRSYWTTFKGYKELTLLDLWKWLDPNTRKDSLMGKFIQDSDLSRVDMLFMFKGHVSFLSLGLLHKWITGQEAFDDDAEGDEDEVIKDEVVVSESTARRFQKRFYLFLSRIIEKQQDYAAKVYLEELDIKQTQEIEKVYETNNDTTLKDEDIDVVDKVDEVSGGITEAQTTVNEITTPKEDDTIIQDIVVNNPNTDEKQITNPTTHQDEDKPHEVEDNYQPNAVVSETQPLSSIIGMVSQIKIKKESDAFGFTERQEKHWEKVAETYKKIPSPDGVKGKTLEHYINEKEDRSIKQEDITIPDIPMVTDKSLLQSSVKTYHRDYIKKSLKRDIAKNVMSIQRTGLNVTHYEVNEERDVAGHYDIHTIQFTPTGGAASTVHLKLPHVDPETQTIRSGSTTYKLKTIRVDKVCRKINDNKVSLTTYYGKLFFNRCTRRKFDQEAWVKSQIDIALMENRFTDVKYGKTIIEIKDLPPLLVEMSKTVKSFKYTSPTIKKTIHVDFSLLKQEGTKIYIGDGLYYETKQGIFVYRNERLDINAPFGFNIHELPVTFAEVKILGEMMPVGWILGRSLGFSHLITKLGLHPEKYESGKQIENHPYNLVIRFADEKWVFDKRTLTQRDMLILGGFLNYQREIKDYSVYDFDSPDVYGSILQSQGLAMKYERELDLINEMFIDPISYDCLVAAKEPTEINELLIYAVELLTTSHHVEEINMDDMMIKGYERIPGAVYRVLVDNLRQFKSKAITHKRRFEMKPNDAFLKIVNDPACEVVDEINPIQNIKEKSNVTYTGEGGRSKRSMVERTRSFSDSDLGVISEASVDSGDVGINIFMSSNPQFTDTFGNTKRLEHPENNPAAIYSVAALAAPFSTHDA